MKNAFSVASLRCLTSMHSLPPLMFHQFQISLFPEGCSFSLLQKTPMLLRVQHQKKNKSPSLLLSHILLTKFVFLDITVNSVLSVIYLPPGTKRVFLFSEILSRCGVINLLISCHIPACFDIYASCLSVLHGTIAFPKNICSTTFLAERNILIVFAGSIS